MIGTFAVLAAPALFATSTPVDNMIPHTMKNPLPSATLATQLLLAAALAHAAPPAGQDAFAGAQVKIDVGGRKLNMYCMGKGAPLVMFEADAGRAGWDWSTVMPQVAARTRACVYDRAGMGASDPIIRASSVGNASRDLSFLLKNAKIDGPLVPVSPAESGAIIAAVMQVLDQQAAK